MIVFTVLIISSKYVYNIGKMLHNEMNNSFQNMHYYFNHNCHAEELLIYSL